ncbi:hydantoinase/oxoprolinase family protein [Rhodoplanes sp. TEM]|uniref:Hydantoinase/oxoprolinase family protein n=1 Tax=Rhodoplanes tepidamans TaxID=200616 RepID=A0ABT5JJJ7_RHOTP|nr:MULTISPECIES: hydantoinase/oxoprolinase family protein [Rhodoplanes]MDC7789185.1 hydantoinase/oxoprolinase family protein [Rhodoplanes tepidamans]MDC7984623.1 hydantoinase/oxoprolinase family protein [Rhodoplanes sp. TEM]MDQ0355568.1 N-methylhydantoinase A [Rhodoplanes tepidamans]
MTHRATEHGATHPQLRIGIDTGGTFTDIVAVDAASGAMRVTKVASTPRNPAIGLVRGVVEILKAGDAGIEDVAGLAHGTTVATNALLQGAIDSLGLIVTAGFRHVLEIARQSVPDGYGNSYFWVKPDRLVPLHRVREVGGRMDFLGRELRPLDEESVRAAARAFRAQDVQAIGICLIHAYANPDHERRVAAIVAEEYPEAVLSLSCEVLPEYREYERTVTTLVDAFVKPHVGRYLRRIADELGPELRQVPFLVMQSSGGVAGAEQVMKKPITTALSGPAAGALGSAVIAEIAGFPDLVTLDAGGTSTDLCLIEGGRPSVTNGGSVGPFPVRLPMIDIKTIGTGGGSIAWISREGHLKVGPKSAGADPGPMCYPNGGSEPTITDANLVLGRIPPALIGGGIPLDRARARAGLAALAARLPGDMTPERLAEGIVEIANWNQANAIRQMTIQRGIDPRDFALLSFGGSGPAQSPAVMALIGMKACIVPPNPGNLSAFGLLAVDWRTDHLVTRVMPERAIDVAALAAIYEGLDEDARRTLERDGIPADRVRLVREADLRYAGQSMEVRVVAPAGPVDEAFVAGLIDAFHAAHRKTFGYDYRGRQTIELVNLTVSGFGVIERPAMPRLAARSGAAPAPARRPVWFDGAFVDTPIVSRATLAPGETISGPLVVEEFGSTTVVFPGQTLTVDPHGILIIRAASGEAGR